MAIYDQRQSGTKNLFIANIHTSPMFDYLLRVMDRVAKNRKFLRIHLCIDDPGDRSQSRRFF